jgi:hypothetical protein
MAKNHDKTIHMGGGLVGGGLVRGAFGGGGLVRGDFGGRNLTGGGLRGGGLVEALDAMATGHVDRDFSQVKPSIDRLAKADPKDVQEIAASQLQLMTGYHKVVVSQASRCFFWALAGAGIGLVFLALAALYSIATGNAVAAMVPFLCGSVVAAVAGLLFHLYGRTAAELSDFHDRLESVQRNLLANSICEGLSGDKKEQTRADLARKIANIPNASFLTAPSQQSPESR